MGMTTEQMQTEEEEQAGPGTGKVAARAPRTAHASYRWLAIGVAAAASVYAWYVFTQYGRLNELNQHQLAATGVEMKRAIENAVGAFSSFEPGPEEKFCDFDADWPTLTIEGPCNREFKKPSEVTVTTTPSLALELKPASVRFRFQTDVVLQDLSFPESFQIIFVANDKGEVLYQDAPGQRRWMRRLRWGNKPFATPAPAARQACRWRTWRTPWAATARPRGRRSAPRARGRRFSLAACGTSVYLQPLAIQIGGAPNLILGGAVPSQMVVRDALAIDTYFTAALVFLVLIGLLGFPFVKLTSLDPHERFRLRDVALLYVSTAALLALFTYAVLGLDGYGRWRDVANGGLKALAEALGNCTPPRCRRSATN